MAKIGPVQLAVGENVRADDTDHEGTITEIDGDLLTVIFPGIDPVTGEPNTRQLDVADVRLNPWDPRFEESGRTGPTSAWTAPPSMPQS